MRCFRIPKALVPLCICLFITVFFKCLAVGVNRYCDGLISIETDSFASQTSSNGAVYERLNGRENTHWLSVDVKKPFRPELGDVMVHLHIPKTSGVTFLKNLHSLYFNPPCKCWGVCKYYGCTCNCPASTGYSWLYSWWTSGLISGIHPGLAELRRFPIHQYLQTDGPILSQMPRDPNTEGPTPNATINRLVWVTMLRDPVDRALSEWTHLTREVPKNIGMWPRTGMICNDPLSSDEGHMCVLPKTLTKGGVSVEIGNEDRWNSGHTNAYVYNMSFELFLECHNSYLFNRQLVMLSDLTEETCPPLGGYTQAKQEMSIPEKRRERKRKWEFLIDSAKRNLRSLDYFGLASEQQLSQELFEWTFQVKFTKDFAQSSSTRTKKTKDKVQQSVINQLDEIIQPDIEFYTFAKDLFYERVDQMNEEEKELRTS